MNHGSEQRAISTRLPFARSGVNTSQAEETGNFCCGTFSCSRLGWRTAEEPAFLEESRLGFRCVLKSLRSLSPGTKSQNEIVFPGHNRVPTSAGMTKLWVS